MTDKFIESLVQEATVVKPARNPFVTSAIWVSLTTLYLLAVAAIYMNYRADLLAKLGQPTFLAEIALLVGIIITSAISAALLTFPDLHQKRWLTLLPALMFMLLAITIGLAWQADNPPAAPPLHEWHCTLEIALLALVPAAWLFYSTRNHASTHPYFTGSTALLSAFGIGALSLRLSEQTDSITHVLQWHYLPLIVVAFIGAYLGKIWLRW